jgi:SWI/SNF-related matrix-associated actin-dependent regulator of chromatin subfamily A3
VTGTRIQTEPPVFKGGILADQMGLGKSLSIIALIASDFSDLASREPRLKITGRMVKATLIIVPLSRWSLPSGKTRMKIDSQ